MVESDYDTQCLHDLCKLLRWKLSRA